MNHEDERPWKAEDMLGAVLRDAEDGSSTTERIERYFDRLKSDSAPTATALTGRPANAPIDRDVSKGPELPTEPPVDVPNHELIRCLGVGGFGQVWLARHTLTEHHRACKLIPADKALELDGLRRLKQRVPAHPGLFPIEDVGAVGDCLYCLMPLADAATTDQAVLDHSAYEPLTLGLHLKRHGRRPTSEAADIGLQLVDAVRHLHAHGVTHGDIKPANAMRLSGAWTLGDYGLVRNLSYPTGGGHTPGYTPPPPEEPGSTKADQYALGVVLMELLTNQMPQMVGGFHTTPIERFKLDHDAPRLAKIIVRATEPDPNDRFGSMDEFADALRAIVSGREITKPMRSRWRWSAFALVASVVLVGVGVVVLNPNRPAPQSTADTLAPAALEVESFEVRHYRYNAVTNETVTLDVINADNPAARTGDDVTVHARFSEPAYVYLLSLDADGRVRPRLPDSPTQAPALGDSLDYPSDPAADPEGFLYNLSRGPGTQGFMLIASADPLPAWSDWIAARGEPTWSRESLPPNVVVLFDGLETRTLASTRDPGPRRGRLVLDPIDWVKAQEGVSSRFIAFPVLPEEEN